ncbi:2-dehydro-3-deoxygalactonokinase [Kordiimonas sp. SCSIO 12603]|uniref:2-dehydro-3-deoxygalactonokinase n=1 Tax=Kordiimonas sp. SCSIO 12603 TaxID=2829596 RepID=UPI0021080F1A|nr:2-dehydro-3-deoxygalactonokinase [Kordiimonas sp. SCSIO 12603]UTW58943.1 2-dehydro-3-deoxygalactonokinase [Kordiimonas sp. SCSIO 12603]
MTGKAYILGDWGTSNLRLYLCGENGTLLDEKSGPGIGSIREKAQETFLNLTSDWQEKYGAMRVTLSGMVGANIGWRKMPYFNCPLNINHLKNQLISFTAEGHQITIVPGLKTKNPLGSPDVMRGEETQIFGVLQMLPELMSGEHLLCLPGTHTKWVHLKNGNIKTFLTTISGELFGLLRKHSVLLDMKVGLPSKVCSAFEAGLARASEQNKTTLLHLIFEVRSKQLVGELPKEDAAAYLSGLITGRDVSGAIQIFGNSNAVKSCVLIGTDTLTNFYKTAMEKHNIHVKTIAGSEAALAGLNAIHTSFQE